MGFPRSAVSPVAKAAMARLKDAVGGERLIDRTRAYHRSDTSKRQQDSLEGVKPSSHHFKIIPTGPLSVKKSDPEIALA